MNMLSNLRVDGFRGICDLEINHLSQVNLIIGDNNCGKTSLLEAVQLLRSESIANIYRVAKLRSSSFFASSNSLYDNFICMFPRSDDNLRIQLSGVCGGDAISYTLSGIESRELLDLNEIDRFSRRDFEDVAGESEIDVFDGNLAYVKNKHLSDEKIHLNRFSRMTGTSLEENNQIEISYVAPFDHFKGNIISSIIKNDSYKEICLKALQLFDDEIEDMMIFRSDIVNRPVEYLKHKKLGNMPLYTYGDGIKKVLVLSNAVASAANGILLIDEIETSIHQKYFDDIFRFIVKACNAFNVQVFITTHSIEAIDGLLGTQDYATQSVSDAITAVTLMRNGGKTYARVLSGRDVYENREAFGFEVRL